MTRYEDLMRKEQILIAAAYRAADPQFGKLWLDHAAVIREKALNLRIDEALEQIGEVE